MTTTKTQTCVLTLMRTRFDPDIDFEAGRKRAKKANANGKSNKGGHAAVRDSRCKLHKYMIRGHYDLRGRDDGELFQGHRAVLWVADGAYQIFNESAVQP